MSKSLADPSSRRDRAAKLVAERGHVAIAELADELNVSQMTVRRDIATLVGEGRVVSFHGGVKIPATEQFPGAFGQRMNAEAGVKGRIAARAAQLVGPLTAIAIDAGSTAALLARALSLAAPAGVRVVTASIPVISALADVEGIDVVGLGGNLRRETQSFIGPSVATAARELQVETYFLGAAGLSNRGAFDVTDLDAVVKRELIEVAVRVVAIVDASKFERRAMSRICGWDAISVLITDDRIPDHAASLLFDSGVELIVVDSHDL